MPKLTSSLDLDDETFLLQFVKNAESAGVLWTVGKISGPRYVVKALVGSEVVQGTNERLHRAIKECVAKALPSGQLSMKG